MLRWFSKEERPKREVRICAKCLGEILKNFVIHISQVVNRSSVHPLGLYRGFALPNWSVRMEEML